MKCHAGVEFESGKPCPRCNAKLGEVCWPGINADLLEVVRIRREKAELESWLAELVDALTDARNAIASLPMETLGYASDPMGQQIHWPIRDELLHRIDNAMHHGLDPVGSPPAVDK